MDAVVGAAIMVVVTTSLLLSIEVAESAFRSVGRDSLSIEEESLLDGIKTSLPDPGDGPDVERQFGDMAQQVKNNLPPY